MPQPVRAVIRDGKIELLEPLDLPDGTIVIITPIETETDVEFWRAASTTALSKIWDNNEDDIYTDLLNP